MLTNSVIRIALQVIKFDRSVCRKSGSVQLKERERVLRKIVKNVGKWKIVQIIMMDRFNDAEKSQSIYE